MARSIADARIPKGWRYVYLDEVTGRCSGHTPSKSHENYWNGGVKWISLTDSHRLDKGYVRDTDKKISLLGVENSSAEIHPAGTVVLSRDAGIGKSGVMAEPMAVSQHFIAWKCDNQSEMDSWFLYNWLQYFKPEFERQAVGSTIKTIGLPFFKKLKIALPPITEQRKIAKILSTWDEAIATTEQLLSNSEQQKKALLQQLITGKRRLSKFREGWKLKKISDFLAESRVQGSSGENAKKLTVKLYGRGVTSKSEVRKGSASTKYYRRSAGQFIYSKLDFLNGAFGIIPKRLDRYESTLDLPAFDFLDGIDPLWFYYHVSREDFYISNIGLANGGRKARRVNPKDFLNIQISMPTLEEQQQIAQVLQIADQEVDILRRQRSILQSEKRALMQQLLTGKRRVKIEEEAEAAIA